jgi:predicted ester cyclase
MAISETLRKQREEICLAHMADENAHAFEQCIAAFEHPRYEIVPTSEVYDGSSRVHELMFENKRGFPDFHFDVEQMHSADSAVIVEGTFRGTHGGIWRGLLATGRSVALPMVIIFRFNGSGMVCERVFFDLGTALRQLGVSHDPNSTIGKIAIALNHPFVLGRAFLRMLWNRAKR